MAQSQGRLFDTPDAPTFYPTEEEFADASAYIESIREVGERAGICVIVPPAGWAPPFCVPEGMTFSPVLQYPQYMQKRLISRDMFMGMLVDYWKPRGKHLTSRPSVDGVTIDLTRLYEEVGRRGGFDKVEASDCWDAVQSCLQLKRAVSDAGIRRCYHTYLLPYEKDQSGTEEAVNSRGASRRQGHAAKRARNEETELAYINSLDCTRCRFGGHEETLVICDCCSKATHLHCAAPPLTKVPVEQWFCEACRAALPTDVLPISAPVKQYTVCEYRKASTQRQRELFPDCEVIGDDAWVAQVERKYWQVVEQGTEEIEVEYGNDLPNDEYASGFPRGEGHTDKHSKSDWNLNNFWKIPGNLLRGVEERISGVNVAWLYLGQCMSSFCWHNEDCFMYSINYHHKGAPKVWYGVPAQATEAFERVMRSSMPELFHRQPDLLFQIATMLSPRVLLQAGIPVCRAVQRPGNFIITFPEAYHAGFNSGFNCAEAMNFGLKDWLPYGMRAIDHYKKFKHQSVLPMQQLLLSIVKHPTKHPRFDPQLLVAQCSQLLNQELQLRSDVCDKGIVRSTEITAAPESVPQCAICCTDVYLSFIRCDCSEHRTVCLLHDKHLCECPAKSRTLHYRYSLAAIEDLIERASHSAAAPKSDSSPEHSSPESLKSERDAAADIAARQPECAASPPKVTVRSRAVKPLLCEKWQHRAQLWSHQAREVMARRGILDDARELVLEAGAFLWRGHEMDPVRELLKELMVGVEWAQQLQDAQSNKIELQELKEMISGASWLLMPRLVRDHEVLIADAEAVVREADQMFGGEMSRKLLVLVSGKLDQLGVCVSGLKGKLAVMESWYTKALDARPDAVPGAARERPSCDSVRQLIQDVKHLPASVPQHEIRQLEEQCRAADEWNTQTQLLYAGTITADKLKGAIEDQAALGVSVGEQLSIMERKLAVAVRWEASALAVAEGANNITLDEIKSLLSEAAALQMSFSDTKAMELQLKRKNWEAEAKVGLKQAAGGASIETVRQLRLTGEEAGFCGVLLERLRALEHEVDSLLLQLEQHFSEAKPQYRAVTATAKGLARFKIHDKRVQSLSIRVDEADRWCAMLAKVRPSRSSDLQPTLGEAQKVLREAAGLSLGLEEVSQLEAQVAQVVKWQKTAHSLLKECTLKSLDVLHRQAPLQLFLIPEVAQIQPAISKAQWKRRAVRLLSAQQDVETLQLLKKDAKAVNITEAHPVCGETFAQLSKMIISGVQLQTFITAAFKKSTSIEQLQALSAQAKDSPLILDGLDELDEKLVAAKEVLEGVEQLLGQEDPPSYQELCGVQRRLSSLKVQPALSGTLRQIKIILAEADKWMGEARELFDTDSDVTHVTHNTDSGLGDAYERGLFAQKSSAKDVCYCGVEDSETAMISCDVCNQWFHVECLGLAPEELDDVEEIALQCPRCTQQAAIPFYFVAQLRQRPSLADVCKLLSEAPGGCIIQMASELRSMCEEVEEWHRQTKQATSVLQVSHTGAQTEQELTEERLFSLLQLVMRADGFLLAPPAYEALLHRMIDSRLKTCLKSANKLTEAEAQQLLQVSCAYPEQMQPSSVAALQQIVDQLDEWNEEVTQVMSWQLELTAFDHLLELGSTMPVVPKKYAQLHNIVTQAAQWQGRAITCLQTLSAKAPAEPSDLNELKALRSESLRIPVRIAQMAEIGSRHKALSRGTKRKTATTVQGLAVNKRQAGLKRKKRANEEETYCICQQTADAVPCMMVICGVCKEWYHIDCIGLSEKDAKGTKDYFCHACSETSK